VIGQLVRQEKKPEDFNLLSVDGKGGINNTPYEPWPGYSRTAGVNYTLFNQPVPQQNLPLQTGIVPPGGIPFLDALLAARRPLYENNNTPQQNNEQAAANLQAQGVDPTTYNGTMADYYRQVQNSLVPQAQTQTVPTPVDNGGIMPVTPDPNTQQNVGGGDIVPTSPAPQSDDGIVPTAATNG
jgi:hypothetical protein